MKKIIILFFFTLTFNSTKGQCGSLNMLFRSTKNSLFASKSKITLFYGNNFNEGKGEIYPTRFNFFMVETEFPFLLYEKSLCKHSSKIDYSLLLYFIDDKTMSIKYIFPISYKNTLVKQLNKKFKRSRNNVWHTCNKRVWFFYEDSRSCTLIYENMTSYE